MLPSEQELRLLRKIPDRLRGSARPQCKVRGLMTAANLSTATLNSTQDHLSVTYVNAIKMLLSKKLFHTPPFPETAGGYVPPNQKNKPRNRKTHDPENKGAHPRETGREPLHSERNLTMRATRAGRRGKDRRDGSRKADRGWLVCLNVQSFTIWSRYLGIVSGSNTEK